MKDKSYISKQKFMEELRRYEKGSVTRRHFLGVTGLGTATAVMAGALPGLSPSRALAGSHIGDRVVLATWPNYHDPENFEIFTEQTGAFTQVNVFGSNEEMLAKLQAGGSGWDVYVPTNYTITTYVDEDLIEPLDLSKLPNYDPACIRSSLCRCRDRGRCCLCGAKELGHHGYRQQHVAQRRCSHRQLERVLRSHDG